MTNDARVFVVDDDQPVRESLQLTLAAAGHSVELFDSAISFLASNAWTTKDCLLTDVRMPDMDGLELQEELARRGSAMPVVVMTGHGDIPLAVRAMKAGAVDFLEKPFSRDLLLRAVRRALEKAALIVEETITASEAKKRLGELTERELEVFKLLLTGLQNKEIGHRLNISPRTVQVHRGRIMDKLAVRSLQDLVRLSIAARQ